MANEKRSRSEQLFDANYGRICAGLEARLFARIAGIFSFIELVGGTSAMAGLLSQHRVLTIIGGLMLAIIPILNYVMSPAKQSAASLVTNRAFAQLIEDAETIDDDELETRLRAAQRAASLDPVEGLRGVAYNATLDEAGHTTDHFALTLWQRFLRLVA